MYAFSKLSKAIPVRGFATFNTVLPTPGANPTQTVTKYGGKYTVTLIPGDGIGVELANSVKTIFKAANAPVEWEQYNFSGLNPDPIVLNEAIESLHRNKVGLKGILYTPVSQVGPKSFNVAMRKDLDIYASVALCKSIPGFSARHQNINFAIIRENTEGEYSGLEHQSFPGVVESLKVTSRAKCERIARFAFDYALKNGMKKVTCVHKANIMKLGDGLFLNTFKRVAEEYKSSGIIHNDMIVDNCSMQLVLKPQQFEVLVMGNLYGNIVSNIGAGLVGGPGLVPGANIGRDHAVFEPGCRHVGRDIKGCNIANPTAMIMSSVMLLRHLNLNREADRIAVALTKVIEEGSVRPKELGGTSTTTDFTLAVISNL